MDRVPPIRKVLRLLPTLLLVLGVVATATPSASGASVNLTQNWGFEEGFKSNGVGVSWEHFVLNGSVRCV